MWWSGASAFNYIELALGRTWAQHVVRRGRNRSMVQRNMANILIFGLYAVSQSPSYPTLKRCVSTLMWTRHIRPSSTFFADQDQIRDKSLSIHKKRVAIPFFSEGIVKQQPPLFWSTCWTTDPDLEAFYFPSLVAFSYEHNLGGHWKSCSHNTVGRFSLLQQSESLYSWWSVLGGLPVSISTERQQTLTQFSMQPS